MEYYLARAFEICRLSISQVEALHAAEAIRPRTLMPHEIQKIFGLPPLKEHYGFPEQDSGHAAMAERMRLELSTRRIAPDRDLSSLDVESVHHFDDRLLLSLESRSLDVGEKRIRIRDKI